MARNPKRTGKGKRAKKGKIQDLPVSGKRGKQVKGGTFTFNSPPLANTLSPSSLNFDKW